MRIARIASLSEVLLDEVESLRARPAGLGAAAVAIEEEGEGEEQQRIIKAEEFVRKVEEAREVAKWKRCLNLSGCSTSIITHPLPLLPLYPFPSSFYTSNAKFISKKPFFLAALYLQLLLLHSINY